MGQTKSERSRSWQRTAKYANLSLVGGAKQQLEE